MSAPKYCIVFDIDDTLYLERDYVRSGFLAVHEFAKKHFGISNFYNQAWNAFEKGIRRTIFNDVLAQNNVPDEPGTISKLVEIYRKHTPNIKLLPDAFTCLQRLKNKTCLTAITDGDKNSQSSKVQALKLDNWLNPILITSNISPNAAKPSSIAYEMIQMTIGCLGSSCAYVADNPKKDFIAPYKLGWRTIRIYRRGGLHYNVSSGNDIQTEITSLDHLELALGWKI